MESWQMVGGCSETWPGNRLYHYWYILVLLGHYPEIAELPLSEARHMAALLPGYALYGYVGGHGWCLGWLEASLTIILVVVVRHAATY